MPVRLAINFCLIILVFSKNVFASGSCTGTFVEPDECFDPEELRDLADNAKKITTLYNNYIGVLTESKFTVNDDEAGSNLFYGGDLPKAIKDAKFIGSTITTFLEMSARYVCKTYDMTPEQMLFCFNQTETTADFYDICHITEPNDCESMDLKYQPLDGICANPQNPKWGATNTPYVRIMKDSYSDRIHEVRSSFEDNSVPSARLLSSGLRALQIPIPYDDTDHIPNDFLVFFLAEITFDIAKTLKEQTYDGNYGFECCDCNGRETISSRFYNHNCFPIEIPDNDKYFRGKKCMNYIRSMLTHDSCKLKASSILNAATDFLDLDHVYSKANVKDILKNHGGTFSEDNDDISHYIVTGDERNLMFPQMFAITKVFLKFHNVVFRELYRLYPDVDNTTIFYESRRFVIGLYQHVVYFEVLPTILSEDIIKEYGLMKTKSCYDSKVDPSVTAEFVSSAFRHFHSYVQNGYYVKDKFNKTTYYKLRDLSYNVTLAFSDECGLFKGLLETPWNSLDIAEEPSNYLFGVNGGIGLDLKALDFQAERDFGIASYCEALKFYDLADHDQCIKRFQEFSEFISDAEKLQFLKYAYDKPCDVDLGIGASVHDTFPQSILSPIFENIIASQFAKFKCGDPYFFTNQFSEDEIDFLKQYTFKDILCLASDNCEAFQSFVFLTPGKMNPLEHCNITLDLEDWKLKVDLETYYTNFKYHHKDEEEYYVPGQEDEPKVDA